MHHFAFVVQASPTLGLGHLMRCLAIGQAAIEQGNNVTFLLDEVSKNVLNNRVDKVGNILLLADYSADSLVSAINTLAMSHQDWLIIDGYHFDNVLIQCLDSQGIQTLVLDDNHLTSDVSASAIVNSAPNKEAKKRYRSFHSVRRFLIGDSYRPLRREYSQIQSMPFSDRHYLTICFGGSDPQNLTIPLLLGLESLHFEGPIRVVTGSGYRNADELNELISAVQLNLEHRHDVQNMAEIWQSSRLSISAAGGSQFELAVCGSPSLLVIVADNQVAATDKAASEGWCKAFDFRSNNRKAIVELASEAQRLWNDGESLKAMFASIENRYDALGAKRIIKELSA